MLILTRRVGESIRLGDELAIEVKAVSGDEVTLAIYAGHHAPFDGRWDNRLYGGQEGRLFHAANACHL